MPIYEYQCNQCHNISEVQQKISDPHPEVCPQCSAKNSLKKIISQTSFVLKGGGWYTDAYSSKGKDAKASTSSPAPTSTPASSSTETSSTTKTETAAPTATKHSCSGGGGCH